MTASNSARAGWRLVAVAGVLAAGSVALFWPGFADYDTVGQYEQVLSGTYLDWHPPAMARLWALLHALVGGGAGPMLLLQLTLFWLGLALIAGALARTGSGKAGAAVLALGAWPVFLGWQAHVLKDAQMTGAALAATGLVAWWRLAGQRVPAGGWAAVSLLLGYAVLVRANAVFAIGPLAMGLVRWRLPARVAGVVVIVVTTVALSPAINHRLLAAQSTDVERTEPIYDLAGIAVRVADPRDTGLDAAAVRRLVARHCVKPFFWDPLGDGDGCERTVQPLRDMSVGQLYATWAGAMLRHPIAYATHRLAHLNSTARWLLPARWPSAAPPGTSEANDDGLRSPSMLAARFERIAGWCAETPLGWPVTFVAAALAAAAIGGRRRKGPARDLSLALIASALGLEASFGVLSIASDLRYHLWPMIATAVALVLLFPLEAEERRAGRWWAVLLVLLIAAGLVARATLPPSPVSYAGMIAT